MAEPLYSVEQVANLLGLHVKTVRGYVRDGRLKAVRIGKQYRISQGDLEVLTGHPVPAPARETAKRERRVEVSTIVQIDAISPAAMSRLTTTLNASLAGQSHDPPARVEAVYDEERAHLKLILLGGLDTVGGLLKITEALLAGRE
jgi:excisionase family DNA binding protein